MKPGAFKNKERKKMTDYPPTTLTVISNASLSMLTQWAIKNHTSCLAFGVRWQLTTKSYTRRAAERERINNKNCEARWMAEQPAFVYSMNYQKEGIKVFFWNAMKTKAYLFAKKLRMRGQRFGANTSVTLTYSQMKSRLIHTLHKLINYRIFSKHFFFLD